MDTAPQRGHAFALSGARSHTSSTCQATVDPRLVVGFTIPSGNLGLLVVAFAREMGVPPLQDSGWSMTESQDAWERLREQMQEFNEKRDEAKKTRQEHERDKSNKPALLNPRRLTQTAC